MKKYTDEQIFGLKSDELNKIPKTRIVDAISSLGWYLKHQQEEIKRLEKAANEEVAVSRQCCKMLAAYLGDELNKPEYGQAEYDCKDLAVLVGRVMALKA
jgi:hypothetical protein